MNVYQVGQPVRYSSKRLTEQRVNSSKDDWTTWLLASATLYE